LRFSPSASALTEMNAQSFEWMRENKLKHNPDFKVVEFDLFRDQAGNNPVKESEILELKKSTSEFIVVFKRKGLQDVDEKVTERVTERVTENQQNILKSIGNNPRITALELASVIGISERKIKENIRKLKQKGLLRCIGAVRGGYLEVVVK